MILMAKVRDIDIKKLSVPKQEFMSALKKTYHKINGKKKAK